MVCLGAETHEDFKRIQKDVEAFFVNAQGNFQVSVGLLPGAYKSTVLHTVYLFM